MASPSAPVATPAGGGTSARPAATSGPKSPAPAGTGELADVTYDLDPSVEARRGGLDADGAVQALRFTDANGANLVVLRTPGTQRDPRLLADHVLLRAATGGAGRVLRAVRDGEEACEFDETAEFVDGSLSVRDDDQDGLGEVTFAYRLACRSDVSESELKLLVLEDGKKYILRGTSSSQFVPDPGDPVPEPARQAWPGASYDQALSRFREFPREF